MIHIVHCRVWWATRMGSKGQEKESLAHKRRGSAAVKKDKDVREMIPSFKKKRLCGLSWPCINGHPWRSKFSISFWMHGSFEKLLIFQGERIFFFFFKFLRCHWRQTAVPPAHPFSHLPCRVRGCSCLQTASERGSVYRVHSAHITGHTFLHSIWSAILFCITGEAKCPYLSKILLLTLDPRRFKFIVLCSCPSLSSTPHVIYYCV